MINTLITQIKDEQESIKDGLVRFPNAENYSLNVGKWQGLQIALELLDDILKGREDAN